ncbi:MAG: NAD-dependent epimerase/dehydratase family protein [Thermoplasmata archaeon]|nr:NAD-dependent epimerase/dehydratase family protein [Thermoplasmata archaeon]
MDRPKIVITGGAGFVGSHLADALVAEADVLAIDNLTAGKKENLEAALKAGASLKKQDLLRADLVPVFRRADVVYHLAANPDVRIGKAGTKPIIDANILATHRVLDACRAAKVPRVVFTSTSTIYGEASTVPTPEDYAPLEPISLYGASKLASEALLSAYAHSLGVQAVIFRMANVVGGRSGHGVVFDLVRKLARDSRRLEILGSDPGTAKSYVYYQDALAGIRAGTLAAEAPVAVYNLGSDDAITVRTIADVICEELGLMNVEYKWTGGASGGRGWAGDVRVMQLANDRLKTTGWRPRMTSEAAVRAAARDAWTAIHGPPAPS